MVLKLFPAIYVIRVNVPLINYKTVSEVCLKLLMLQEELDAGAIIAQEVVPVQPDDDENTLQERIKQSEHVAFPRALQLLTSNAITLSDNGKIKWRTK